jgi:hypothetical protein
MIRHFQLVSRFHFKSYRIVFHFAPSISKLQDLKTNGNNHKLQNFLIYGTLYSSEFQIVVQKLIRVQNILC